MIMRFPDEPTTPEQWQVIAWCAILVLFALGAVGIYFSIGAPPDKLDLARRLRHLSYAAWGIAAAVYAVKRAVSVFLG